MANGFRFGGVHSDAFGLILNKKIVPLSPPIMNRLQEIGGVDGAWDYGISYAPREIELEVTLLADSPSELREKARALTGILSPRNGPKALIFDDEPEIQYFARLANQIPLAQLGAMGTFTIQFTCPDPFTYAVDGRSGTFMNDITIEHRGTHVSKPVLTVTHGGGVGSIVNTRPDSVVETLTFTKDSPTGTYVIDCKEKTMTIGGERAYNFVKGPYLSLAEGSNAITNSGAISSTRIDFRDTWI